MKGETMAINLTITVPEKLHKRLQEVKKNFNVSQACQKAIETEVKRQELLKSGIDDMKDVIERLRLEKTELAKKSYDLGYKWGLEELADIPYKALVILDKYRDDPDQAADECEEKGVWNTLSFYLREGVTSCEGLEGEEGVDDAIFAEGYLKAILDFYDKIKDKL